MINSPQSQNSFSRGLNYSNITATLSLILWSIVWFQLNSLNDRMRMVELDLVKIKTIHGIETGELPNNSLNRSISDQIGRSAQPGLDFSP